MFRETKARSILKAITWRSAGTIATSIIVFIFTRKISLAFTVGFLEFVSKMAIYFFHERIWDKISFGRREAIPCVIWLTGLSAAGKKAIAENLYRILTAKSFNVERLDGEKIRAIFPKIGFTKSERDRHIKRVGLLASLLEKNKVIVIASFISPYQESRSFVRKMCNNFIEVYVDTPLEECEKRDPRGLYKKARQGLLKLFTGIDDPYEPPQNPEITLSTKDISPEEAAKKIIKYLEVNKFLS
ncbi:MAG: adenylyl-sulfate kinase [Candidatus Omnitrophica bacterium]|nr:adenylyl-sulfate kinase [Candidatus Omnitrophota bacterium]